MTEQLGHPLGDSTIEELIARVAATPPWIAPPVSTLRGSAAVGVILLDTGTPEGPELLFIERAHREGDYWSGDIAFPGGRADATDTGIEATARREVAEELGIDLPPAVARLDDFDSRRYRRNFELVVSPFVFALSRRPEIVRSEEVADALWIPLSHLVDPGSRITYERRIGAGHQRAPGLRHGSHVIWGMTYRMLGTLTHRLGIDLPNDDAPPEPPEL